MDNIYDTLQEENSTPSIIKNSVAQLSSIIREASRKCSMYSTNTRQGRKADMPWHDRECKTYRNTFLRAKRNMKKHKTTQTLRALQDARTIYSKCCKAKKAVHEEQVTEAHMKLKYENPRLFWKAVKPNKKHDFPITLDSFYIHFSENNSHNMKYNTQVDNSRSYDYITHYDEELDQPFTVSEIAQGISSMKHNRSPGYDNILNECLLYCNDKILCITTCIFNHLFNLTTFPECWSKGMIVPVYKKGDTNVPSNYRPITLLSAISKLFTRTLCKRISKWATENFIFTEAQFGFRPSYSTTDTCFTLYLLINRIKKKTKLYCAFIDFSTAFDSINRVMLFNKLMECGISSKMLNMIIALYNNVTSCVKLKNSITDEFPCEVGLRQGDCLSPILFSLYINDLPGKLSRTKHMTDIDILLYADDLAMLANSREELQDKLNLLHLYCKDRNLHVNINKSKIMVFNAIKDTRPFMYNDSKLDEVDSFKYLGMTINRRANLQYSQKISIQQALKAKASLECYLNNHKHMPVKDVFDLFDTLVKPIILFNSEIWGININKELEQFHLSFMKRILGVKKSTNNCLIYAETGRYPLYICIYIRIVKYWFKSRLHQSIDIFTLFIISVLALGHYLCEKYYMNMVSATSGRLML